MQLKPNTSYHTRNGRIAKTGDRIFYSHLTNDSFYYAKIDDLYQIGVWLNGQIRRDIETDLDLIEELAEPNLPPPEILTLV